MGLFNGKALPRGIKELMLGRSVNVLREAYNPKEWGEYKVELNRGEGILSFVLRFPQDPKNPFKVVSADCPVSDSSESLFENASYRLSFFYRPEVKRELGEPLMLEHASKRYGRSPTSAPTISGFYKTYRWEDAKTRIDLGLGYQYDRLQFMDITLGDWLRSSGDQLKKVQSFHDLF